MRGDTGTLATRGHPTAEAWEAYLRHDPVGSGCDPTVTAVEAHLVKCKKCRVFAGVMAGMGPVCDRIFETKLPWVLRYHQSWGSGEPVLHAGLMGGMEALRRSGAAIRDFFRALRPAAPAGVMAGTKKPRTTVISFARHDGTEYAAKASVHRDALLMDSGSDAVLDLDVSIDVEAGETLLREIGASKLEELVEREAQVSVVSLDHGLGDPPLLLRPEAAHQSRMRLRQRTSKGGLELAYSAVLPVPEAYFPGVAVRSALRELSEEWGQEGLTLPYHIHVPV